MLTFIIPVRHPENSANWELLKSNLATTVASVAAQSQLGWKAVIVANRGADLPPLPEGFEVRWVDFAPNAFHDGGTADVTSTNAFRRDKGTRVLAGMLHAGTTGHFMIVDDDDLVSRKLSSFVAKHPSANGWYIDDGYLFGHGGKLLCRYPKFADFCGTSLIVRSDLYGLPSSAADASDDYICRMLGSHRMIAPYLDRAGTPLAPLPFPGAVYRVGHSGAHSKSRGLVSLVFFRKQLLRNPLEFPRRLLRLRALSGALRREFFAGNSRSSGLGSVLRGSIE